MMLHMGGHIAEGQATRLWQAFQAPLLGTLSAVAAFVCLAAALRALFRPWLFGLMAAAGSLHSLAAHLSLHKGPEHRRLASLCTVVAWFCRFMVSSSHSPECCAP